MPVRKRRLVMLAAFSAILLALAPLSPATAGHDDDPTRNLRKLGHIVEPASLLNPDVGNPNIHTDIAFWGDYAFQGSWLGFNIRDISNPLNPTHVSFTSCQGNQGDVVVWNNILVRSWNSPAAGTEDCDGTTVPAGFEGLHVFDIRDLNDPVLVGSVDLSDGAVGRCGSHTATGVPDQANARLLIYNSGSQCDGIDIVEVPLGNPAAASYLRTELTDRHCHDTGVILGDAMLAACAGDEGFTLWTLDGTGSLTDPDELMSITVPDVGIGHSAAFSWDGSVLVFGHEPGGGVVANCQATNPDSDKSMYFFDTATGDLLGTWVLPRDQSDTENCTIHNYNIVPTRDGRDIVSVGNYQAGTWLVEFTNPARPRTLAWSDPPPIDPPDLGGAWSSYWYNGAIYETNITEGLNIFRHMGAETRGALNLRHLNPQTQEFTL